MRAAVVALCLAPLLAAAPTLNEPYGNSEEALNAAIWSLGAKNLLELGPSRSVRGALVSPHGGTKGDGIYAHHPPLVVWLMTLPVALGAWEGGSRLLGLCCACVSLWLLWRLLRRSFEPRAAVCGLAAAALSVFVLRYGRMFTTLTLMTPLFLAALELKGTRWFLPLVALLVLSSWDGVVAAAVLVALERRAAPAIVFGVSLAFVGWHLVDATGGTHELLWQFKWRAAGDDVTLSDWLGSQARFVGEGLGLVSLLALFVSPFLFSRPVPSPQPSPLQGERGTSSAFTSFLVLALPGLVMLLVFRQGSHKHAFWAFNLVLPAAFAVAALVKRLPRVAWLVAAQAAACIALAAYRLNEEHEQNQLGLVARTLPRDAVIAVVAARSFHPYVSWYAHSRPLTVHALNELPPGDGVALVDTEYARTLGVAPSEGPRWQVRALATLIADAQAPLR